MTYGPRLRARYPELAPTLEDLFLLEAHQVAQLPVRAPARELAVVLHARPELFRFFVTRDPSIAAFLTSLLTDQEPTSPEHVDEAADTVLWEIGDWILYQRMPELYDERVTFEPGLSAIEDVAVVERKVVIDAGAGTGQLAFAVAPLAEHVFAIEPVARLRDYMRDRARQRGVDNLYVIDGFLHEMPLPPGAADVVLTRQAIGWQLAAELDEVERVLDHCGTALHLLGMPHPAGPDDPFHSRLLTHGYEEGTYTEGGAQKRRYWKHLTP